MMKHTQIIKRLLLIGALLGGMGLFSASAYAAITELGKNGIPYPPGEFGDTPPELACTPPQLWVAEGVHKSFPRTTLKLDDEQVYVSGGNAVALNRQTGETVWRFVPQGNFQYIDIFDGNGVETLALDGDVIYYGGWFRAVYALNKHTGELLWKAEFDNYTLEVLEVGKDQIYVNTFDTVYALNKKDGSVAWKRDIANKDEDGYHVVRLAGDKLIVMVQNALYGLDARTGKPLWTYQGIERRNKYGDLLPSFPHSYKPSIFKNQLITTEYLDANTTKRTLVGIDVNTGKRLWGIPFDDFADPMIVTTPENRLIFRSGSFIGQFDVAKLKMDWWFRMATTGATRSPALSGDLVLFGDDSYYLYAMNRLTGDEVFRYRFDKEVGGVRTIVADKGVMYFMSLTGNVYAHKIECPQLAGQ